ncbi:MAG: TIGR00730 family Rossman fold protein [Bacteroidales bacterium]|nr:TIGR00730 family Rossman fold protein [Bacteroidales bacterium]
MNINLANIKPGIAVYCSSSTRINPLYLKAAHELGVDIARAGVPVINGGGKMSMMAAVTEGALEVGGIAIGVIPQFMFEADRHHKSLSYMIVTKDMHERKATMARLSRGVIAMPGGVGTLDELAEMMTWHKLGLYHGPVVILNINGYFDPLLAWLQLSIEQEFTEAEHLPWMVATNPKKAVELIMKNE